MARTIPFLAGWCWLTLAFVQSQDIWDTTINHTVTENLVSVDFPPADGTKYNYSIYSVVLWFVSTNLTAESVCDGELGRAVATHRAQMHLPSIHEKFDNIGPSGYYCIRVCPVKADEDSWIEESRTVKSSIFFLKGNNSLSLNDCSLWTVFLNLQLWPNHRRAYVSYNVSNSLGGCLERFRVDLWFGVKDRCDGTSGKVIRNRILLGLQNKFTFTHLMSGNYCVRISPFKARCSGYCQPIFSSVKQLHDYQSLAVTASPILPKKKSDRSWLLSTLLGIFSVFVVLALLVVLHWRYKKKIQAVKDKDILKEENIKMKTKEESQCPVPEEIFLLNIYKNKQEVENVRKLANFLRSCCGLKACMMDEELHQSVIRPEDWLDQKLSGSRCKVIVVESHDSVSYQEDTVNSTFLDLLFCHALDLVKARNPVDYRKIFVVRFGSVPTSRPMDCIVPCKRYSLPHHLLELYCDLVEAPLIHLLHDTDVVQIWKSQPSYLALQDSFSKPVA